VDSDVLSILCATVPNAPVAPTTTNVGSSINVAWTLPATNGAAITGYRVFLLANSGSYIEESDACRNNAALVSSRSCLVPLTTLIAAPYSLSLGDSVYAEVIA
jgi:hypothetical protein